MQVNLSRRAQKTLLKLPAKIRRQAEGKIREIAQLGKSCHDLKPLHGPGHFWRADTGEYRIVVRFEDDIVMVYLIGKRNDDEVYKELKRMFS